MKITDINAFVDNETLRFRTTLSDVPLPKAKRETLIAGFSSGVRAALNTLVASKAVEVNAQ